MDLRGFFDPDQTAEGREQVDGTSRLVLNATTGDFAFPIEDAGNAVPAFEERSFLAAQFSATLLSIAAVVRGVNDNGVV